MHRLVFFIIGVLELVVTVLLVGIAFQMPSTADVDTSFQSAERVTDHAGTQVRLLRDQVQTLRRMELQQLSARLQRQTEAITNTLRTQTVDFETVSTMRDAAGDLGKGLAELADKLDTTSLGKLSNGLGQTAAFLEEKVVPDAQRQEVNQEQSIEGPRAESDRLKEMAGALRKAQTGLDSTLARWPELRTTLKQLSAVLKTTNYQLDQAVQHRNQYEAALEQTEQVAETFACMLPLVTDQLEGRLDEEEQTLADLGQSLDDVGKALPAYAHTTSRLVWAGRLLAWLVAAIIGLHGGYLTFSSSLSDIKIQRKLIRMRP